MLNRFKGELGRSSFRKPEVKRRLGLNRVDGQNNSKKRRAVEIDYTVGFDVRDTQLVGPFANSFEGQGVPLPGNMHKEKVVVMAVQDGDGEVTDLD